MAATDTFRRVTADLDDPASSAVAITPNDSTDLTVVTRGIYVGGAGSVKVDMQTSGTVTFVGCVAGQTLAIRAKRVYSTGTTATNLLSLY